MFTSHDVLERCIVRSHRVLCATMFFIWYSFWESKHCHRFWMTLSVVSNSSTCANVICSIVYIILSMLNLMHSLFTSLQFPAQWAIVFIVQDNGMSMIYGIVDFNQITKRTLSHSTESLLFKDDLLIPIQWVQLYT